MKTKTFPKLKNEKRSKLFRESDLTEAIKLNCPYITVRQNADDKFRSYYFSRNIENVTMVRKYFKSLGCTVRTTKVY